MNSSHGIPPGLKSAPTVLAVVQAVIQHARPGHGRLVQRYGHRINAGRQDGGAILGGSGAENDLGHIVLNVNRRRNGTPYRLQKGPLPMVAQGQRA